MLYSLVSVAGFHGRGCIVIFQRCYGCRYIISSAIGCLSGKLIERIGQILIISGDDVIDGNIGRDFDICRQLVKVRVAAQLARAIFQK